MTISWLLVRICLLQSFKRKEREREKKERARREGERRKKSK